jgi:hypothetical protein
LASELCQIVEDNSFFTWHIFLEVGKTQDALGDALSVVKGGIEKSQTDHMDALQIRLINVSTLPLRADPTKLQVV